MSGHKPFRNTATRWHTGTVCNAGAATCSRLEHVLGKSISQCPGLHDFDMCGRGRVPAIVTWVQDRSTSSECRERFQAGAFSESTGGLCRVLFALLSVGVLAVCQWPLGASVFILMHFFRMCLSSRGAGNSSEFMGGRVDPCRGRPLQGSTLGGDSGSNSSSNNLPRGAHNERLGLHARASCENKKPEF